MDATLINACNGKSASKGGLNVSELKAVLSQLLPEYTGEINKATRPTLQKICEDKLLSVPILLSKPKKIPTVIENNHQKKLLTGQFIPEKYDEFEYPALKLYKSPKKFEKPTTIWIGPKKSPPKTPELPEPSFAYHGKIEPLYGLSFDKFIGEGSSGNVYKVTYRDKIYAAKNGASIAEYNVALYIQQKCPFLPKIYGYYNVDGEDFILMEYIKGTTLLNYKKKIGCIQRIQMAESIARQVECLHNAGIVHGDIYERNIIIDKNDNPHIIDYGLSCTILELFNEKDRIGVPVIKKCSTDVKFDQDIGQLTYVIKYILFVIPDSEKCDENIRKEFRLLINNSYYSLSFADELKNLLEHHKHSIK